MNKNDDLIAVFKAYAFGLLSFHALHDEEEATILMLALDALITKIKEYESEYCINEDDITS